MKDSDSINVRWSRVLLAYFQATGTEWSPSSPKGNATLRTAFTSILGSTEAFEGDLKWKARRPSRHSPARAWRSGSGFPRSLRLASLKNEYALAAKEPSNLRYGYVRAA